VTSHPDADNVGDYLISSRSFDEYQAMFMLTKRDLCGRILDCPGGGSSFAVQASDLGARVTAVDPVYAIATSAHRGMRKRSAALFAHDVEEHPERYLPASPG
jgi:hypothetical protein